MTRRRKRIHQISHDRWLVSYADFITLLFAFFVVMYSAAQVDQRKVGKLAAAIQVAFKELGVFPPSANTPGSAPLSQIQAIDAQRIAALERKGPPSPESPLVDQSGDLSFLRHELEGALSPEIRRGEVELHSGADGLVISLREVGFFDSGSSAIKHASLTALGRMARILSERRYRIRIEGHTDNVPIHNSTFTSNWELSTARAIEVVRLLILRFGFDPGDLSAAGYAEFHPASDNRTESGRAMNRRVDIVVLGRDTSLRSELAPSSRNTPPTSSE